MPPPSLPNVNCIYVQSGNEEKAPHPALFLPGTSPLAALVADGV